MVDIVIEAIKAGKINSDNISFRNLRAFAGRDLNLKDYLDFGRAILTNPEELDQYLYTYGRMTEDKWNELLDGLSYMPANMQLNDYGCGQGLASALLFDHFGPTFVDRVSRIVLVEPSLPALKRAKSIVSCYSDKIEIVAINKKLDDVGADELATSNDVTEVHHVFSEVLDIADFNQFSLFSKMFASEGQHTVFAVSHDRNFHGGSARFMDLQAAINDPKHKNWLTLLRSEIRKFKCRGERRAITWFLEAEVSSGSV